MNKKTYYISPKTTVFVLSSDYICDVKVSTLSAKTEYDDISTIGEDDDNTILPTANKIWFDEDEAE